MIIIGIIASALAAGMFWSPNFDKRPEKREGIPEEGDPIADTRLEERTIHIYLGDLGSEKLEQLGSLYSNTPLFRIIDEYRDAVQGALEEEAEMARREVYTHQLNLNGYKDELLAPLDTEILEMILKNLR